MPADVLVVCTGNWHRSPIVEHLFRGALATHGVTDINIRSAGTIARPGVPMPAETLRVLGDRGVDASSFRTTYLDEAALDGVDVLIGAERAHRAAGVTLRPALLNRAFTLFELTRICGDISPSELDAPPGAQRLMELVRIAAGRRTHTLPDIAADDDLPDPIGQPMEAFVQCADVVQRSVDVIVGMLA
jgi:protein-tyrosine phosphatase